jgi:hypothetical protein
VWLQCLGKLLRKWAMHTAMEIPAYDPNTYSDQSLNFREDKQADIESNALNLLDTFNRSVKSSRRVKPAELKITFSYDG